MIRDTEDVVEAVARIIEPCWFTDDGRPPIVNNYPDQHVVVQERAREKARAIIEMVSQSLSDRIDVLEGEKARLADRLKLLSLDVLQWWKTVFGVDYVHTLPGETPGELAARAAERIAALHQEGING